MQLTAINARATLSIFGNERTPELGQFRALLLAALGSRAPHGHIRRGHDERRRLSISPESWRGHALRAE